MTDYPFEKVWDEFLQGDSIEELIKSHISEHKSFLQVIQRYVESLQSGESVNILEIGCGTAIDSYYIAEQTKAKIWAIDVSPKSIKVAEKVGRYFNHKINLKIANAVKTDFENNFFDLIFSQGVIEHFRDPVPVMKEQIRLLRTDGYIIIDVPQKYNIYTLYRKLLTKMGRWPYEWERGYSITELRKLGNRMGLKTVDVSSRGLTCELSKSKRPYIAVLGKFYDFFMRNFHKFFHKFSIYYMQNICVVFTKDKI